MKKQHEHLGQIFLIYGIAFLTPLGSAVITYLRGEDIDKNLYSIDYINMSLIESCCELLARYI